MKNHTRGYWVVFDASINLPGTEGGNEVHAHVNGQLVMVAECCKGDFSEYYPETWEGKRFPEYHLSNDEALANARLIAAAPDLLAALELLMNGWISITTSSDTLEIAFAAINKARGTS